MTRPKAARTTTPINFRMPDDLLERIDSLADKNYHDRSSEINNACRYWITSGAGETWASQTAEPYGKGKSAEDAVIRFAKSDTERPLSGGTGVADKIGDLESGIRLLADEQERISASLAALQTEIAALAASHERERTHLLKIIEGHETTIRSILQFADKKAEKDPDVRQ